MESSLTLAVQRKSTFASKAKQDTRVLKEILKPGTAGDLCLIKDSNQLEYLKDPIGWIASYSGHVTDFKEDDHYLEYVIGLLEMIVRSSPYRADLHDIYTPILLLQKIVTREELMLRRDPMRTALRLQYRLRVYAKIENDNNSICDRKIEDLMKIPKDFALSLMEACVTPIEVINLMKMEDETMFGDVLKAQNTQLVASKIYQKLWWKKFWGYDLTDRDSPLGNIFERTLHAITGIAFFLMCNIFYLPFSLYLRLLCSKEDREKHRKVFFSPYSSYLADRMNYTMLIALLWFVILTTSPDLDSTYDLLKELKEGRVTAANNSNFEVTEDGSILVMLPRPEILPAEIVLWVCVFGKALAGFYHVMQKRGSSFLKRYISNFFNVVDAAFLLLLLAGMIVKLELYTRPRSSIYGVYNSDGVSTLRVPKGMELTIYFYSLGAVVALVNVLQIYTIHIPKLGPLIQSARETFAAASSLIFLFAFFVLGFIVPMMGMFTCYRNVHGMADSMSKKDFFYFSTFGNTVITLMWTMFGGLAANHRDNLHRIDNDDVATVFIILVFLLYAIVLGVLCVNYIFVIMIQVYNKVHADKDAHWRFSQFTSIMQYSAVRNHGNFSMPFLVPFCIPYIVHALIAKPCRRTEEIKSEKDNSFARFLCKHRLKQGSVQTTGES